METYNLILLHLVCGTNFVWATSKVNYNNAREPKCLLMRSCLGRIVFYRTILYLYMRSNGLCVTVQSIWEEDIDGSTPSWPIIYESSHYFPGQENNSIGVVHVLNSNQIIVIVTVAVEEDIGLWKGRFTVRSVIEYDLECGNEFIDVETNNKL